MDASTPTRRAEAPTRSPPASLAVRDLLVLSATAWLFRTSRTLDVGGGPFAIGVDVLTGVLIAVSAFYLHEWGHLFGTFLTGGRVDYPSSWRTLFLFKFDDRNDRRQFLAMATGGFAASGISIAGMLVIFRFEAVTDWVAIVLSILGLIATVVLEFPPFWRVLRGAPVPRDYVKIR